MGVSIGRFPGDRKSSPLFEVLKAQCQVSGCTIVVGTEGSNTINVSLQFIGLDQANISERIAFDWYLSGDADGDGQLATAPNGGVAIGTDGFILEAWTTTTDTVGKGLTTSTGAIDFDITDTTTPTMYLIVILPSGKIIPSGAITFA